MVGEDEGRIRRRRRVSPVGLLALLAAAPAVVAAISVIGLRWLPASDYAVIEVRVRDLASVHPPLVGPYTRLGGNHPGPAMYVALGLPYLLSGANPWGLLVGAAAVNGAAIVTTVWLLGRRGRSGLAGLGTILILACAWGMGPDHLREPWNPRLAVFPFLLAVVATWAAAVGERWALPVAVGAASFSLQSHVGYAPLVGVLAAWWLAAVWSQRSNRPTWQRPVLVAVAIGLVMWSPPLAQQAVGARGNLTSLVHEVGAGPPIGYRSAIDLAGPHLGAPPAWFRPAPGDPVELHGRSGIPMPPWGLIAWSAGLAVAIRRRHRDAVLLAGLTASLWVVGIISLAHLSGLPASYLYRWIRVLGLLLWLSALWPVGAALAVATSERSRAPGPIAARRAGAAVLGVVAVAASLVAFDVAATSPMADYRMRYQRFAPLAHRTVVVADRTAGKGAVVEVRSDGLVAYVMPALVAELERSGHPVVVARSSGRVWGSQRRPGARRPDLVVVIHDGRARAPGARVIGRVALLDPEASARLRQLARRYGRSCGPGRGGVWCAQIKDLEPADRTVTVSVLDAGT